MVKLRRWRWCSLRVRMCRNGGRPWMRTSGGRPSTKAMHIYYPLEIFEALDVLAIAKEELSIACSRAGVDCLAKYASHYRMLLCMCFAALSTSCSVSPSASGMLATHQDLYCGWCFWESEICLALSYKDVVGRIFFFPVDFEIW